MKIYILADMEGISGIRMEEQVRRDGSPEYTQGKRLMMQEINVAVAAAFEAGATEVVACDTHGGGGQIELDQMDARAIYETPNCGVMMPALDSTFAGVVLLGHHARAGTLNGFLDHTESSAAWYEYMINDTVVGEVGIEAAFAGHFDVPVLAVTGDAAAAAEARALLGRVECGIVKWGVGRNRARCLALPAAHEEVRQAIGRGIRNREQATPYKPSLPATLRLTFYRSDMADNVSMQTGVRRVGARTVEKTITSLLDVEGW